MIKSAEEDTPEYANGFDKDTKEMIILRLNLAAEYLRKAREDRENTIDAILKEIEEVTSYVKAAPLYVKTVTNAKEKPFKVLKRWSQGMANGSDTYEERDYYEGPPNDHGRYQQWKNNRYYSNGQPPLMDSRRWRVGDGYHTDMSTLLRRMGDVIDIDHFDGERH